MLSVQSCMLRQKAATTLLLSAETGASRWSPWPDSARRRWLMALCTAALLSGPGVFAKESGPEPATTATEVQVNHDIEALLNQIQDQINNGHTMTPENENALVTWRQVLETATLTAPGTRKALAAFVEHSRQRVESELAAGNAIVASDLSVFADQASNLLAQDDMGRDRTAQAPSPTTPEPTTPEPLSLGPTSLGPTSPRAYNGTVPPLRLPADVAAEVDAMAKGQDRSTATNATALPRENEPAPEQLAHGRSDVSNDGSSGSNAPHPAGTDDTGSTTVAEGPTPTDTGNARSTAARDPGSAEPADPQPSETATAPTQPAQPGAAPSGPTPSGATPSGPTPSGTDTASVSPSGSEPDATRSGTANDTGSTTAATEQQPNNSATSSTQLTQGGADTSAGSPPPAEADAARPGASGNTGSTTAVTEPQSGDTAPSSTHLAQGGSGVSADKAPRAAADTARSEAAVDTGSTTAAAEPQPSLVAPSFMRLAHGGANTSGASARPTETDAARPGTANDTGSTTAETKPQPNLPAPLPMQLAHGGLETTARNPGTPDAGLGQGLKPAAPPSERPATPTMTPAARNSGWGARDPAAAAAFASRGDAMVALKDISAARKYYEYAANAGNARAALALGETYDPAFLVRLGTVGLKPNPAIAADWYRKAAALGDRVASGRLQALALEASK